VRIRVRKAKIPSAVSLCYPDLEDKQGPFLNIVRYLPYMWQNQGKPVAVLMVDTRGITRWCHSFSGLNEKCHMGGI
jgi:hypothetical protein